LLRSLSFLRASLGVWVTGEDWSVTRRLR
jgi:hypothetical protein